MLKVETDIITSISASLIGRAGIFVIMSVEAWDICDNVCGGLGYL